MSLTPGTLLTPPPGDVAKDISGSIADQVDYVALIGGLVGTILLVLICIIAALTCLSRHKGSYDTNELDDEDDDMVNADEDEEEEESSDMMMQVKQPLQSKEDK